MDQYICTVCSNTFEEKDFCFRIRNGRRSHKSWCKGCSLKKNRVARKEGRWANNPDVSKRGIAKAKSDRHSGHKLSRFVLEDSRKSDRKRGLSNNLDYDFLDERLKQPCQYCGGTYVRMTLDRIDNAIGHTKENVVPACYRCNLIRGSMPYEAWLNIVSAIRDTYEKGLFGDWRTQPIARKRKE